MPSSVEKLERRRLLEVAREYEDRGYQVIIEPQASELPAFLTNLQPDLIAHGPDESVVVEIKSQETLAKSPGLSALAEAIEGRPGWRLELVVTNPKEEARRFEDGEPLDESEIGSRVQRAKAFLRQGETEIALILVGAAIEGASRLVAQRHGIELDHHSPSYAVKTLYTFGVIGRDDFDILRDGIELRNRIIHAYRATDLEPHVIQRLIVTIERLLVDQPSS